MAYAPIEDGDDAAKDEFYQTLEQAVQRAGQADLILGLGDFITVSGTARDGYQSVVGAFGSGSPKNNTDRLLTFCSWRWASTCGILVSAPEHQQEYMVLQ